MSDPIKKAETLRPKAFKDGTFFLAKIGGSEQEPDSKKLFHDYFRYKDYIKNPEWLNGSFEEVWSPKFLGVDANKSKILEFQNPAYSAGFRMKDDPRNWNRVFTLQLAACNYMCSYCYVPRELNLAQSNFGRYFSAKEILDKLEKAQIKYEHEKKTNVIRLSGGEIGIAPEIIVEVYNEIERRDMLDKTYIWCDTNLSVFKYFENIESELKNIIKKKNIGIVGCFKGTNPTHFVLMTGTKSIYYNEQFKTAKFLVDLGSDFYVYLPTLIPGNKSKMEEELSNFISNIQKINKNLPPRTELIAIHDYPGAIINKKLAAAEGRVVPVCDQKAVFDIWYNKLMPKLYPKFVNKYCCQVPL